VTALQSSAVIVAENAGGPSACRTRCTTLRSAPPLTLRATDAGVVHVVGSAAGPVGGDDLHLAVTVGGGAALTIRSVAASIVLPGPADAPSSLAVEADLGSGASLRWLPQPTVAVVGCDHRAASTIRLAVDARLVWREVVVLGRHGEAPGSVVQRLRVDVAGRPLVRNDLAVGPRWPGSLGPGGVGGARAVGTALVVGHDLDAPAVDESVAAAVAAGSDGVRAAVLRLDDRAALVTVVAAGARGAIAAVDAALAPLLEPAVRMA
jgi:urease accessory protein